MSSSGSGFVLIAHSERGSAIGRLLRARQDKSRVVRVMNTLHFTGHPGIGDVQRIPSSVEFVGVVVGIEIDLVGRMILSSELLFDPFGQRFVYVTRIGYDVFPAQLCQFVPALEFDLVSTSVGSSDT